MKNDGQYIYRSKSEDKIANKIHYIPICFHFRKVQIFLKMCDYAQQAMGNLNAWKRETVG
jgi:hypothetical protein